MALQSSGPISIGNINTEFGFAPTTTRSMSQLYRNGGIVPDASANNAVPTSGAISLGNFYGAVNRVQQTVTLATNQSNYVLNTAKVPGYIAGITDVTLVINSGVYVSASTTGQYALDVDTSWNAGDTITIINNGFIVGMGGEGGTGRTRNTSNVFTAGSAGGAGGPAFRAQRAVSMTNNGTIAGGGGGGGGGGDTWFYDIVPDPGPSA